MSLIRNIAASVAAVAMALSAPAFAGANQDVRASSPVKKGENLVAGLLTPLLIIGGIAASAAIIAVASSDDDEAPASP